MLRVVANEAGSLQDMFKLEEQAGQSVAVATDGAPRRVVLGADAGAPNVLKSKVYPNPFMAELSLQLDDALATTATLELLDVNGRLLREQALPLGTRTTRLAGLSLPAGSYLLRVRDDRTGAIRFAQVVETVLP